MADRKVSDWFLKAAEVEANTPIAVGVSRFRDVRRPINSGIERLALGKLIELRRRQCGLSTEELATQAKVGLSAVIELERGDIAAGDTHTVRQIALALKIPEAKMLQLAGLSPSPDQHFRNATIEFAAQTEPVEALKPEEQKALEQFMAVLAAG